MDDMDEGFLKLTNHKDHPTNKAYKVFFFYQEDKALYFEKLLDYILDHQDVQIMTGREIHDWYTNQVKK